MRLNGRDYKVVGIMPKGFDFPVPMELWVPLTLGPAEKADRAQLSLNALGRLRPGVSVAQARAALETVSQHLRHEYPRTNGNRTAMVLQLRKELYLYTLPLFLLLQAAAVSVLARYAPLPVLLAVPASAARIAFTTRAMRSVLRP